MLSVLSADRTFSALPIALLAAFAFCTERVPYLRRHPVVAGVAEAAFAGATVALSGGATSPMLPYLLAPGLALGLAAALATTLALPRGWSRAVFMVGWAATVAWATVPRAEGDYLVPANGSGVLLLVGSFVVLLVALATSAPVRAPREDPGDRPAAT